MKKIKERQAWTGTKPNVGGSGIEWQYFFGGSSGYTFDRYYRAVINGVECEKHSSSRGTVYCIGNMDKAKKKYKTEIELVQALSA